MLRNKVATIDSFCARGFFNLGPRNRSRKNNNNSRNFLRFYSVGGIIFAKSCL